MIHLLKIFVIHTLSILFYYFQIKFYIILHSSINRLKYYSSTDSIYFYLIKFDHLVNLIEKIQSNSIKSNFISSSILADFNNLIRIPKNIIILSNDLFYFVLILFFQIRSIVVKHLPLIVKC